MTEEILEDDPVQEMALFGTDQRQLTIDQKSGGYIIRIHSNEKNRTSKLKHDMIAITYPPSQGDSQELRQETRVIVEVINDYTFVIDKPFENLEKLPSVIMDFKFINIEGARTTSQMSSSEHNQHLKSFGLEIIHARFVFCRKCAFSQTYQIGDTLTFV